jgi:hypothetical protein
MPGCRESPRFQQESQASSARPVRQPELGSWSGRGLSTHWNPPCGRGIQFSQVLGSKLHNERRDIFRDAADRELFLTGLSEMKERFRMGLHGYVLMSNHFHLILEPIEGNLCRAMQWLNVS